MDNRALFKRYEMGQPQLLPPSVEELIPEKHLVRVVNALIDKLKIATIESGYKGGGTSSYHPRMMLKLIVYAYAEKNYSGRQIAKSVRENIPYMWLSGGNRPDFRTINRFRSERLKEKIQGVFTEVLEELIAGGYIKLENYFVDGTKIEANANRYSYVWKKSTLRRRQELEQKVGELFEKIDSLQAEEDAKYAEEDLEELGGGKGIESKDLEALAKRIDQILAEETEPQKVWEVKKVKKQINEDLLPRLIKYEDYEDMLGERNSCSKTDPDATFMQMKEDHMRNRSMKAGYNVQVGTEGQYILGFSLHQNAADSVTLRAHLEQLKKNLKQLPPTWVADAGYGNEENYQLLEREGIAAYLKYPGFDREKQKRAKLSEREKYQARQFQYQDEQNSYLCPQGKLLHFEGISEEISATGYRSLKQEYRCRDCKGCVAKEFCSPKSSCGRTLSVGPELVRLRQNAFSKLTSEIGVKLRKMRLAEVEAVFGLLKGNGSFRRFHLRGLNKVEVEWGILSIAHNLKKMAV
jgi:transposase